MTIDPMPRMDVELPPRHPEAAEIARLRAALDAANARAQEAALEALAAQGQAADAHDARVKAEAERDAARAKALNEALERIDAVSNLASKPAFAAAIRAMIQTREQKG